MTSLTEKARPSKLLSGLNFLNFSDQIASLFVEWTEAG
jgi:hypothetical protein